LYIEQLFFSKQGLLNKIKKVEFEFKI